MQTGGYSSVPEDCTPAIASYLNGIPTDSSTIIATILDLFRKGYIKVDNGNDGKSKDVPDETFIITKVKKDAVNKGYFDKSKTKYGVLLLILFILLIYGITLFFVYSDHGHSQYKKWKEFRKYLNKYKNYTTIDDFSRYPLDISLIYALSLGINNEILNKFYINTPDTANNYYSSNAWLYWYFLLNNNKHNVFDRSIDNSFGSIGSSSSGSFSSGGGGGAGGGGAGGF